MKAWVSILALVLFPRMALAVDAMTLSYGQLGDLIRQNNKSIQGSVEAGAAARQRVGTLDQAFLPKIGAEGGLADQREANGLRDTAPFWKLDVSANIYRGGRDEIGVLVRESQALIKEMDTQALFRAELFKAKLDYVQLNSIRRDIDLTTASMKDYEGIRKAVLVKVSAGLMTPTSARVIHLEIDELSRQLSLLRRDEAEYEDRLALTLGLEPDQKLDLSTAQFEIDPSLDPEVSDGDIQNLPELKTYDLLAQGSSLESGIRNEWWVPDVSVFAAYTGFGVEGRNEVRSLPEREMNFGFRLSVDLDAKKIMDAERLAKTSDAASLASRREYLRREIEHKVHEYRRELQVQADLIRSIDESVERTEKLLKQVRREFERGLGSSSDMSTLVRSKNQLERDRIESVKEYYLALAGLETLKSLRGR